MIIAIVPWAVYTASGRRTRIPYKGWGVTSEAGDNGVVRQLIAEAQGGDREALGELLQKFVPLRKSIAKKWLRQLSDIGMEGADLYQQIALLFIEEVYRFDPAKNPNALLHLKVALPRAVAAWYKKEWNDGWKKRIAEGIVAPEPDLVTTSDGAVPSPVEDELFPPEGRRSRIPDLTAKQQLVVVAMAQAGTQKGAAALLGVTQQAVASSLQTIRKKIAAN